MTLQLGARAPQLTGRSAGQRRLSWVAATVAAGVAGLLHRVPFAEYVPLRSLVRKSTTLVDRVRADFIAGDRPGVLDLAGTTVGDVICFEVAYDNLDRDTVTGGAQLLAVQTNNATFNYAEATQQLAMVRLSPVEHGRPALMASTVGASAFVGPDAIVYQATPMNTQAVLVRPVRLGTGRTLATRLGATVEWALVAALAALITAGRLRRRVTAQASQPPTGGAAVSPTDPPPEQP